MRWGRLGAVVAALAVLLACQAQAAEPSRPAPTAPVTPAPTATTPPPPRPTAAPPALSPLSSPVASPAAVASPRPASPVRLGLLGALSDSGLLIAQDQGYFAERGLDPRLTLYDSPGAALAALRSGQADAACLPISAELFNTLGRDRLRLVAEAGGAPPGHGAAGLLVRRELIERLETPTDLRGFRVGLPPESDSLEVELAALLKQGWLARTDVRLLPLPPAEIAAGLAKARLDAALLPEPLLTDLVQRDLGQVWRRADRMLPNHQTAALVLTTDFSQRQPDAARGLLTAYLKAVRQYNEDLLRGRSAQRKELLEILERGTTAGDAARLDQIVLPGINPNGMINMQTLRLDQQHFLATGRQRQRVNLAAFVDTQYAAYAITQLGEFR
jgi:ABC-type nitrate/sulfonate/bicarbonate transport system substrate-binding protein